MSLKLFRSTGYSSMFEPGETRASTHPGWVVLLAVAWVALACNVALWRVLPFIAAPGQLPQVLFALGLSLLMAAITGLLLGALAWRKMLKPVTALLLLAWAVLAAQLWRQGVPLGPGQPLPAPSTVVAALSTGWQELRLWAVLLALTVLPLLALHRTTVKSLPVARQLRFNLQLLAASLVMALLCLRWLFPSLGWPLR